MNRYQQLAQQLKDQILANTWRSGEKIPSIRATSKSFSVSSATVLQAYQILESEGWIKAKPQSGYFVTSTLERKSEVNRPQVTRPPFHDELYEFFNANNQATVSFGSAFPSPSLFPLAALNRHLASAGRKCSSDSVIQNMPPGNESLRRFIAQRYISQGMDVSHDDVVVTSGAMEALNLSLEVVCNQGDTVVIESPAFYGVLQAVKRLNLNAIEIDVDPIRGIDLIALEKAFKENDVKACWVMANFQNPTGVTLSDKHKQRVVELAKQHSVALIEDDVYAELYFGNVRPSPLKFWDVDDSVLLCGSLSKSLCPGFRIGWVVNRSYAQKLQKQQLISTLSGSAPIQQGVAHYLQYESYDNHLRKLRKMLSQRQTDCVALIKQYFPSNTTVHVPEGGYFVWVELSEKVDAYQLYCELRGRGISIGYGSLFASSERYQHCLRINVSFECNDNLKEALQLVAQQVAILTV